MSIPIKKEPNIGPPYERCVFCRRPTNHWTNMKNRTDGEQVACCPMCADIKDEVEVLSKKEWCNRERSFEKLMPITE